MQAEGRNPGCGRETWIPLRKLRSIQATLASLPPGYAGSGLRGTSLRQPATLAGYG